MPAPRLIALVLAATAMAAAPGCTSSSNVIGVVANDSGADTATDSDGDAATEMTPTVEAAASSPATSDGDSAQTPEAPSDDPLTNRRAVRPAPAPRQVQSRGDLRRSTGLELVTIADLPGALGMAVRPGSDSLFVALQPGFIAELQPTGADTYEQRQQWVLDVSNNTTSSGERGLLGIAFSPNGSQLYTVWTDADTGANQLVEFTIGADGLVDPTSERLVLEVEQPARNHNGGQIAFGPDGYLYYGLGDGGGSGDPYDQGQNPSTLLGAILRIDPSAQAGQPYGIPPDNPFVDGSAGAPEVWVYGVRNPWRFSFDAETGDLWIADVGQGEREEINVLWSDRDYAGVNLGWPNMEGSVPFAGTDDPAFVAPIHDYPHADGACSVTGGYVYRGNALPSLRGTYVFADYCNGALMALNAQGDDLLVGALGVPDRPDKTVGSFGEGADGELYVLGLDGAISRIESLR